MRPRGSGPALPVVLAGALACSVALAGPSEGFGVEIKAAHVGQSERGVAPSL